MKATAPKISATAARAAAVFIGCSLAANAMASSNKVIVCDKTVRDDMKTLDIPLEDISVSAVDHIAREKPAAITDSLEISDRDVAAVTVPSTLLTPRTGEEFDYVFSLGSDDVSETVEYESAEPQQRGQRSTAEDAATAPSALNSEAPEDDELRIQDKMFRKDI